MTSPPIGTDQELIERLRIIVKCEQDDDDGIDEYIVLTIDEAADALQSRISDVERLTEALNRLHSAAQLVFNRGAVTGPQWTKLGMEMALARAALSQQGKV